MKTINLAILFVLLLAVQAPRQSSGTSLARAFESLGTSRIDNEMMITDPINPKVIVLFADHSNESLILFSIIGGQAQTVWRLAQLPEFMSVADPAALRVKITDNGPIILMHGCAKHLCGGHGLAGSLAYVVHERKMYTAFASWSASTATMKYTYSPEENTAEYQAIKDLLDDMLREEGYDPKDHR